MAFSGTHPSLLGALAARSYIDPTPVQQAVLRPDAASRDLLVSAQTGSGKTVAYGIALAPMLLGDAARFVHAQKPLALVIAPTRELALQVQRELQWLFADTGARVISSVGGMDIRREQRLLAQGAHIVVGTPGRLADHLDQKHLDLSQIRSVVLDEADEMLDLGFREELEALLDATPSDRRTLLFSATLPKAIMGLAKRYQKNALRLALSRENEPHRDIEYRAFPIRPRDSEHAVVNSLRYFDAQGALVFCSTREAVRHLHANLQERGFSAVALSGELKQHERTNALAGIARRTRSRMRGDGCGCTRSGYAGSRIGDPRRFAAKPGGAAASQRPHRTGGPQRIVRDAGAGTAPSRRRAIAGGGEDQSNLVARSFC